MSDPTLRTLVGESRLVRSIERGFDLIAAAWRSSFVRRRLDQVVSSAPDRAASRVRLAGWAAISASATRIGVAGVDVISATPGSGWAWLVVAALGVVYIRYPEAVVAAWVRSRSRMRMTRM